MSARNTLASGKPGGRVGFGGLLPYETDLLQTASSLLHLWPPARGSAWPGGCAWTKQQRSPRGSRPLQPATRTRQLAPWGSAFRPEHASWQSGSCAGPGNPTASAPAPTPGRCADACGREVSGCAAGTTGGRQCISRQEATAQKPANGRRSAGCHPRCLDIPNFALAKMRVATGFKPFPEGIAWLKAKGYTTVLANPCSWGRLTRCPASVSKSEPRYLSLEVSPELLNRESGGEIQSYCHGLRQPAAVRLRPGWFPGGSIVAAPFPPVRRCLRG